MTRAAATIITLLSAIFLPWQITIACAIGAAFIEPLVPVAVGILLDLLYYLPQTGLLPRFSLVGVVVSLIASLVHSRVRTRTM